MIGESANSQAGLPERHLENLPVQIDHRETMLHNVLYVRHEVRRRPSDHPSHGSQ